MNEGNTCKYICHDNTEKLRIVDYVDASITGECECIKFNSSIYQHKSKLEDTSLFIDPHFSILPTDIRHLQQEFKEKIVLKRICRLFPKHHRPPLFANHQAKSIIPRKGLLPSFIYQIPMLRPQTFKSIILCNQISENGRYQVIVNRNGKYELEVIDDVIPIFEGTQQPIWYEYFKEPWQLIIMKTWAKLKGSFQQIKNTSSFEFIEHFTQSNWKYFNLAVEGTEFLAYAKHKSGKNCRILLKSKSSQKLLDSGLVPGRISYELLGIDSTNSTSIVMIRTGFENAWTGKLSIVDKSLNFTDKMKQGYKLNYTLTLTVLDFLNMFSMAYVTHANLPLPIYRSYYQFSNSANFNAARYFVIHFKKEGYFNFSIQQPQANLIAISSIHQKQNHVSASSRIKDRRYLSLKYILSRKISSQNSKIYLDDPSQLSKIGSLIRDSNIKFDQKYNSIQYDLYQTAHRQGFTKGNAHFMNIIPGTYILRVKAETTLMESHFAIHYSTHQYTQMEQIFMTKQQSIEFLQHNIISISDQTPHQSLSKQKYESLSVSDCTDTLGYGFAVLKVDKKCPYKVVIQVDPKQLNADGYKLKNIYKQEKTVFKVEVGKGQSKAIIFKRITERKTYKQPKNAFKIQILKS